MSIYDKNGWLNINYLEGFDASFYIIVGERQIGKTFGVLKRLLYDHDDRKVLLLRRTEDELEMITANEDLSPFKSINDFTGRNMEIHKMNKSYLIEEFDHVDDNTMKDVYKTKGQALSLGKIAKTRGFDGSAFTDIVIDEFIPESHVRRLKNEGDVIKNAYTTVSGNREVNGKPPLKLWLLANSNNLADIVLQSFNVTNELEEMIRKGKTFKYDDKRKLCIVVSNKSPIADKRKQGVLYNLLEGDRFTEMAYNANFSYNDLSHVRKCKDSRQLKPLVAVGKIYIYQWNTNLYVTDIKHMEFKITYGDNSDDLKTFRNKYNDLYLIDVLGKAYFSNYMNRNLFLEYLGRNEK